MKKPILLFVAALIPFTAHAWGRRGHQIVGENAALLAAGEPNAEFMRGHSFDFGYYANVPDFIWKRPATYDTEKPQHFMDLEIFNREFAKRPEIEHPLELKRKEFDEKFPTITLAAGRAFWRIRELFADLEKATEAVREFKEETGIARQNLQSKWILTAGVMAHYVGDLSMPLHVSENFDGQMTGQKGIHAYFEDVMVDTLYPELNCEVNKEAQKQWPGFVKANKDKTVLQLLEQLAEHSNKAIPQLLAMDKKFKRDEVKKNAHAYRPLIRARLVDSILTLAELYRRNLGWKFDDNRFYYFGGEPTYMPPGEHPPAEHSAGGH